MATFAERIKAARQSLALSQAAFAKELGYSRSQLIMWEQGKYTPGAQALTSIAEKLSVTTGYLLGLTDDPKAESSEADLSLDELLLVALDRLGQATHAVQQALTRLRSSERRT